MMHITAEYDQINVLKLCIVDFLVSHCAMTSAVAAKPQTPCHGESISGSLRQVLERFNPLGSATSCAPNIFKSF